MSLNCRYRSSWFDEIVAVPKLRNISASITRTCHMRSCHFVQVSHYGSEVTSTHIFAQSNIKRTDFHVLFLLPRNLALKEMFHGTGSAPLKSLSPGESRHLLNSLVAIVSKVIACLT